MSRVLPLIRPCGPRLDDDHFPARMGSIVFLTSYCWEGAVLLKGLLDPRVGLTDLVIQRPWWGRHSFTRSRLRFTLKGWRFNAVPGKPRRYYSLERTARHGGLGIHYIDDINASGMQWQQDKIRLIIVAGSRIIKPPVVARFHGRVVNFHSGLLPHYRGPYSEFWAMYHERPDLISSSVHIIDDGIDTGPLLATCAARLPAGPLTPQDAHHLNVLQAVPVVADTISGYLRGEIIPVPQPPGGATYRHPYSEELATMITRVDRRFRVDFIE